MYTAIVYNTCLSIGRPKIRKKTIEKFNFLFFTLLISYLSIMNLFPVNYIVGRFGEFTNVSNKTISIVLVVKCGLLIGYPLKKLIS